MVEPILQERSAFNWRLLVNQDDLRRENLPQSLDDDFSDSPALSYSQTFEYSKESFEYSKVWDCVVKALASIHIKPSGTFEYPMKSSLTFTLILDPI